jgi:hypothetical protein
MAVSIPLLVDVVCIRTINVVQHLVHVSIGSLNDEVIVIAHEHIAVKPIAEFILRFEKVFLELVVITFSEKDPLPLIASRSDMIKSSFVLNPQRSSHTYASRSK